eukprot:TRINITY_DN28691_c0_g2_i1.p1 TRINITY_DN28691_c0_g2~~TRINITY_DN28691_c0_g2_i1.p1  ORF type:complete len:309 (-),score=29.65 TRINITY_DN28691_c0_g2_i1:135-1061(-)
MTEVLNSLSAGDRVRTFFAAVGVEPHMVYNKGFCRGAFPATMSSNWWRSWGVEQRDVVIMRRKLESGVWETYCKFSMNAFTEAFESVVQHLLVISAGLRNRVMVVRGSVALEVSDGRDGAEALVNHPKATGVFQASIADIAQVPSDLVNVSAAVVSPRRLALISEELGNADADGEFDNRRLAGVHVNVDFTVMPLDYNPRARDSLSEALRTKSQVDFLASFTRHLSSVGTSRVLSVASVEILDADDEIERRATTKQAPSSLRGTTTILTRVVLERPARRPASFTTRGQQLSYSVSSFSLLTITASLGV